MDKSSNSKLNFDLVSIVLSYRAIITTWVRIKCARWSLPNLLQKKNVLDDTCFWSNDATKHLESDFWEGDDEVLRLSRHFHLPNICQTSSTKLKLAQSSTSWSMHLRVTVALYKYTNKPCDAENDSSTFLSICLFIWFSSLPFSRICNMDKYFLLKFLRVIFISRSLCNIRV